MVMGGNTNQIIFVILRNMKVLMLKADLDDTNWLTIDILEL